jgi:TetR/AcrR family transcriptional repressor of mexJK operon
MVLGALAGRVKNYKLYRVVQQIPPSRRPARRGRRPDLRKRRAILAAASQLFLARGYAGTSMAAVAQAAGVAKLTVYAHFADKETLFRAIVVARCDAYNRPERFEDYPRMTPRAALTAIGTNLLDLLLSPIALRLYRVMIAEGPQRRKMASLFYEAGPERASAYFVDYLRKADAQRQLRIDDAERAADEFQALVKGGKLHLRASLGLRPLPNAAQRKAHVARAVETFLRAYGVKG